MINGALRFLSDHLHPVAPTQAALHLTRIVATPLTALPALPPAPLPGSAQQPEGSSRTLSHSPEEFRDLKRHVCIHVHSSQVDAAHVSIGR